MLSPMLMSFSYASKMPFCGAQTCEHIVTRCATRRNDNTRQRSVRKSIVSMSASALSLLSCRCHKRSESAANQFAVTQQRAHCTRIDQSTINMPFILLLCAHKTCWQRQLCRRRRGCRHRRLFVLLLCAGQHVVAANHWPPCGASK